MKILKLLALAFMFIAIGFYSCKKEAGTTVTSDAVIRNTGPVNGCGYVMVIQLNNGTFSPTNLTPEFQPTDTLKVRVTYKLLNTFHSCTNTEAGYQEIEVKNIAKID